MLQLSVFDRKIYTGLMRALFMLAALYLLTHSALLWSQGDARNQNVSQLHTLGAVEYVEVNTPAPDGSPKPLIIFVHGTPGSLSAFSTYLNDPIMRDHFHMISVTRPGWVGDNEEKVTSLAQQAAALEPLLRKDELGQGAILMGHSYGGPVIARTAMDYPSLVSGLVFVATTGDPNLSGPRWYNRFAVVLPRFLLGSGLKGANAEIWSLKPQLIEMLPRWEGLTMPTLIIQGSDDRLVNPRNADFLAKALSNAEVTYIKRKGVGHFVLWQEAPLIRDAILERF